MAGRQTGVRLGKIGISLRETVERKAKEAALKKLEKRVDKVQNIARKETEKVIEQYLKKNRVMRSLAGLQSGSAFGVGLDLQAEFGLKSFLAKKAVDIITEILKNTVRVEIERNDYSRGVGSRLTINISALITSRYKSELLGYGAPLRYVSTAFVSLARKRGAKKADIHMRRAKKDINWIKWLLEPYRGIGTIKESIPDIDYYGISYDKKYVSGHHSRSDRAVMVRGDLRETRSISYGEVHEGEIRAGGAGGIGQLRPPPAWKGVTEFPYEYPKRAIPENGARNFIDEIAQRPEFKKDIKARVTKALSDYLEATQ
jgi:hypothetical protein